MSIIGKFVTKIMPSPVSGINFNKDCFYRVSLQKVGDEIFLTFSGEGLKSFGSSTKSESEGFKEALVLALLRGVEDEREKICREYGKDLEDCKTIMYWMDLKIPEHRVFINPLGKKMILHYDYLLFDNFGFGFTSSKDERIDQYRGKTNVLIYKANFITFSYITNIIPQVNVGGIVGILISGEVDSTTTAAFYYDKNVKMKLSNSSTHFTIFGGYQINNIEYSFGIQSTNYNIVNEEYELCSNDYYSSDSRCYSGDKLEDVNILSPLIGIGILF